MGPNPNMASKPTLDVLDNWEDLEETDVLEKNFKRQIPLDAPVDNKSNGMIGSQNPVKLILTGDDALRTQYVPPEPTVKILKRPSKSAQNSSDNKILVPKKTLQQREQEYAEARLRILGKPTVCEKPEEKISIQNKQKTPEIPNVIRLPKGPDGSKGFTIRR